MTCWPSCRRLTTPPPPRRCARSWPTRLTPGYQAEFDPEEAERAGAFVEDALSEQDAAESGDDLVEVAGRREEPAFLDDEGPSDDIPPFINTTNARELYDWKPGETVAEAIARKKAQEG
jgi:hypothetical protein